MLRRFKVILEWDEEVGAYTVTVPALPGCVTQGRTVEESLERVREAITGYLKAMKLARV
ncbi:MAG TPA: type II toxin-antitoxin system HicB family antitoxin [Firmicutes bacterium]|nr:type II toxin-antitoxin system HicB family antitoxin [Bacillota bacterium]